MVRFATLTRLSIPLAALALSGCISFGAKPPATLLTLFPAATMAAGESRTAAAGQAVTILTPRVPAALANNRIPVQSGDTSIAYVKDALWADSPNRLFRSLLAEVVTARTGRLVLDNRQFSLDPGMTITGELRNFTIDESAMEAVVTYDAARAVGSGIEERRFEARAPVSAIEPGAASIALNTAANKVADQVADWIGK
jgi:cholesterol transport system auxiliary component